MITYFRPESVDIAVQILDDSEIKPGVRIKVTKAQFEKGVKKNKGIKRTLPKGKVKIYDQRKELSWDEDENRNVILKYMFTIEEAKGNDSFFTDLEEEIKDECEKLGDVGKVKIFEHNPDGVIAVKFADHYAAERCVERMNGRFFAGRRVEAFFYDGWTDYRVGEEKDQEEQRIDEFGRWLEEGEEEEGKGEDEQKT